MPQQRDQAAKYRAQELPQFIDSMKRMIENQKKEIERAIVGMGEYKISSEFSEFKSTPEIFSDVRSSKGKDCKTIFHSKVHCYSR
jgi:hypothetical protein